MRPVKVTGLFQTLCVDLTFLSTPVGTWARDAFEHVIAALLKKLPKDQVRTTYLSGVRMNYILSLIVNVTYDAPVAM